MAALRAIASADLLAGALDITATTTLMFFQGLTVERLWQGIASGALGDAAFKGGKGTAAAGLVFHFVIALVVASVYFAASLSVEVLIARPILCGVVYGAAVHLVMSRIVVPLSRAPLRVFSIKAFLIQLAIHICFVGLPVALIVSRFSR